MLSAYSSEHLVSEDTDVSEVWKLFSEAHLILGTKQQSDYKSLITKAFDGSTFKMKVASPI